MKEYKSRKTNRLKNYDYSTNGCYFVTICSKENQNIFGEYDQNTVGTGLAPVRDKNHNQCNKGQPQGLSFVAPVHYENNDVQLTLLGKIINTQWNKIPEQHNNIHLDCHVIMPNHIHGIAVIDKRTGASPVPTISKVIGTFKSKTSIEYLRYIKNKTLNIPGQIWQRSFHDHVIRNEKSLNTIREYIVNNPANWAEDEENKNRITTHLPPLFGVGYQQVSLNVEAVGKV